MTEMAIVEPRLRPFVNRMRENLAKIGNQQKSDWREETRTKLLSSLVHEVSELLLAIDDMDPKQIASECADVANYAMMIADRETSV